MRKRLEKLFWILNRGILENHPGFLTVGHFARFVCTGGRDRQCDHAKIENGGDFGMYKLGEFVHYKSKITFRIAS